MKYLLITFCCLALTACQNGLVTEQQATKTSSELCSNTIRNIPAEKNSVNQQVINLADQEGRGLKVWLGLPEVKEKAAKPYLVFSHGAFSSPERYEKLLKPFVQAGYIVAAPWHIDSEDIVKATPLTPQKNWIERRKDIAALLQETDLFDPYLKDQGVEIDLDSIGVFGHSYGGFTVQAFAGAYAVDPADGVNKTEYTNSVRAVLAYSPPGPIASFINDNAWQKLAAPSMVVSGDADVLPGFIDDWKLHLVSYETAPAGNNWAFIGVGADHYFGKQIGRLGTPDPNQIEAFDASITTSLAFMDFYLKDRQDALDCLKSFMHGSALPAKFLLKRR